MKNVWVICYIDASKTDFIVRDLRKKSLYSEVTAYVPTVRILQKNHKQKEVFEYVPLLFNYGFLKLPISLACDSNFLSKLKEDIQCIYGWVKDPAKALKSRIRLTIAEKAEDFTVNHVPVAVATERDIANMILSEENQSIYSQKEIENLKIGQIITLRGYPFDHVLAEILAINVSKKEVRVKLLLENLIQEKEVKVTFDNIFYTVYRAYDSEKDMRESSIEEISSRGVNGESKMFAEFLMKNHE